MEELNHKILLKALKSGAEKAIKLNKALGLSYMTVNDDQLVSIAPDGSETIIGKPMFGDVVVEKLIFSLKSEK